MRFLLGCLVALSLFSCEPGDPGRLDRTPLRTIPGPGSLIPSRDEENLRISNALAQDLEGSIAELDGVESARVHIDLADRSILSRDREALTRAAVVVVRSPGGAPDQTAVKALAAQAVPGLSEERVRVFLSGPRAPVAGTERIGPIEVADASAPVVKAFLAALIGLCLVMALGLIGAGFKIRRIKQER